MCCLLYNYVIFVLVLHNEHNELLVLHDELSVWLFVWSFEYYGYYYVAVPYRTLHVYGALGCP